MEWQYIVAIVIAGFVALFPAALVWYICIGGICEAVRSKERAKSLKKAPTNLTCTIDADCPRGYVCVNGRCVPAGQAS